MPTNQQTYQNSVFALISNRVSIYKALAKHKLTLIVVITSLLGFIYAGSTILNPKLITLFIAGYLVTASANAINQILEKEYDALMKRTMNRPLPLNQISDIEAWLFAGISGVVGTLLLWVSFNSTTALVGLLSILSYAFIYTPLKRVHPIAVFVGAFPGALPPLIGYLAFAGTLTNEALLLFGFQFLWQFPHFWAIAWLAFDDYKKAGYKLLPNGKKDRSVAIQSILFTVLLIILSFVPYFYGITTLLTSFLCFVVSVAYLFPAVNLFYSSNDKDAKALMFTSFAYLPIIFTILILGQ